MHNKARQFVPDSEKQHVRAWLRDGSAQAVRTVDGAVQIGSGFRLGVSPQARSWLRSSGRELPPGIVHMASLCQPVEFEVAFAECQLMLTAGMGQFRLAVRELTNQRSQTMRAGILRKHLEWRGDEQLLRDQTAYQ